MQLSPPTKSTWSIAVLAGVLGIAGRLMAIPVASEYSFGLVAIGFILLALGSCLRGM
jgi:hypothetical protein